MLSNAVRYTVRQLDHTIYPIITIFEHIVCECLPSSLHIFCQHGRSLSAHIRLAIVNRVARHQMNKAMSSRFETGYLFVQQAIEAMMAMKSASLDEIEWNMDILTT